MCRYVQKEVQAFKEKKNKKQKTNLFFISIGLLHCICNTVRETNDTIHTYADQRGRPT